MFPSCGSQPSGKSVRLDRDFVQDLNSTEIQKPIGFANPKSDLASRFALRIATFNIEQFGSKTIANEENFAEKRLNKLQEFIASQLHNIDVFALQEIADQQHAKELLSDEYKCTSYDDKVGAQNVVVCVKNPLLFVKPAFDDNFTIEEISQGGWLRPAVHGMIQNKKGENLAYLSVVHLKAKPGDAFRETRLRQAEQLVKEAAKVPSSIPIIFTGDFNTYDGEADEISQLIKDNKLNLENVTQNLKRTFLGFSNSRVFDHFWLSSSLEKTNHGYSNEADSNVFVETIPPCSEDSSYEYELEFKNYISDHCPVILNIEKF